MSSVACKFTGNAHLSLSIMSSCCVMLSSKNAHPSDDGLRILEASQALQENILAQTLS